MKNITIRQLRTFESVARNLGFSRAANELRLTQRAVSMQIKQMEAQAGISLFNQTGIRSIARECLKVRESGTDTRSSTNDTFCSHQSTRRFMEIGCAEAIKPAVVAGIGISFLPAHTVQPEVRPGLLKVLDVQGFPLKRHWRVAHRADRHLPQADLDFRRFLISEGGLRLKLFTRIDRVHTGMEVQRSDHVPGETRTIVASSAGHERASHSRAVTRRPTAT